MKNINIICKHYAGSIAYGTNHENSDVDFRGIFTLNKNDFFSPFIEKITEFEDTSEEDTKYYELSNFFKLASRMNPNIIETLWIDKKNIVESNEIYDLLRKNRNLFLSQKIADTTIGFVKNRMSSMKSRNKWINNPQPKEAPSQSDYMELIQNHTQNKKDNLDIKEYNTGYQLIHYGDNIFALLKNEDSTALNKDGTLKITPNKKTPEATPDFILKFNKDEYSTAKTNHKNYWNWIKNRNTKNSILEEKHGYKTKDAMHLIRILRVGEEALRYGTINVKRNDANELKDILEGKWTYKKVVDYIDLKTKKINLLLNVTKLPKEPDYQKLNDLLHQAYDMAWQKKPTPKISNAKRLKF